jgi:cephalosporin-C deacetylase
VTEPVTPAWPDAEEFTSYPLADLLTAREAPPRPADFADFWRASYAELTATDPTPRIERDEAGSGKTVQRISFRSSTGGRVLGWLVGPEPGRPVRRGLVISHGYGGRSEPEPAMVPADAAAIFPVAPWLPANSDGVASAEHVLIGIGDRDRYAHRFAAADIWRAATALLQRFPEAAGCLDYRGGSFGGGIGALALPWDDRFRRATLDVPSFGDFPVRLSRRCEGSGEAVRRHLLASPGHRPMLDYFDAAIAAGSITIPVHVAAAQLDPAVDPRGQFAVYHALAGPKQLAVYTAGHADFEGYARENGDVEAEARAFLAAPEVPDVPRIFHAATGSTLDPATMSG